MLWSLWSELTNHSAAAVRNIISISWQARTHATIILRHSSHPSHLSHCLNPAFKCSILFLPKIHPLVFLKMSQISSAYKGRHNRRNNMPQSVKIVTDKKEKNITANTWPSQLTLSTMYSNIVSLVSQQGSCNLELCALRNSSSLALSSSSSRAPTLHISANTNRLPRCSAE